MRPATLFTVAAETVYVGDCYRDSLAYRQARPVPLGGKGDFCVTDTVQTRALPLHHARKCTARLTPERGEDYTYEDMWYYVSPEVQKLLELTVQPRIDALSAELRHREARCEELQFSVDATERAMLAFSKLPWWLRAYKAVFKGVLA